MNSTKLMLLLVGSMTASSALYAAQTFIFEKLDTDHNGAISMSEAEVRPDLTKNFSEIDKNGNGTLSVDEYSRYMNAGAPPEDVEIPEPGAAPVQ